MTGRFGRILAAVVGLCAVAGCGHAPVPAQRTPGLQESLTTTSTPVTVGEDVTGFRRAVTLTDTLVVRSDSSSSSPVTARLGRRTVLGSPTVLLAVQRRGDWIKVLLPVRPNDSAGWVVSSSVRLEPVTGSMDVDLRARRLRIVLDGRVLAETMVAIGSPQNPTPTGLFFVTDRVRPPDRNGDYGAFALGLSAHSDALSEFHGSDGQVGIHGTNDQGSIGRPVSHGCIRVPAGVDEVLSMVPIGTPVTVH